MNLGFRVWDVKKSRFVDTGEIQFSFYGDTSVKVYPNEILCGHIEEYEHDVLNGRFIVQQRTGLKDQNDRNIYKDDVILVHQFLFGGAEIEKEFKGVVVWIASVGSYGVKVIDQMNNNFLDYTGYENLEEMPPFTFSSLYGLHEESFEVIGNIHENPELLNND